MVFFGDLRVDGVSCGCAVFGGGGGASGDLYLEPPAQGLHLQFGSAAVRGHAVPGQRVSQSCKTQEAQPGGNFRRAEGAAQQTSGAVALEVT